MGKLVLALVLVSALACERATPPRPTPAPDAPRKCDRQSHWAMSYDQCEQECKAGSAQACYLAAKMHWGSQGVVGNERGVLLAEMGCELGSGQSCAQASAFHRDGRGGEKNPTKAAEYGQRAAQLFETECAAANADSCDQLAWWYANGFHVDKDAAKAKTLTARMLRLETAACKAGDGRSCADLALTVEHDIEDLSQLQAALDTPTPTKQRVQAQTLYAQGCKYGYMPACVEQADAVDDTDHAKALGLLETACERGYGRACSQRAIDAFGTPTYEHYQRLACERFHARSCADIGRSDLACKYGAKDECESPP